MNATHTPESPEWALHDETPSTVLLRSDGTAIARIFRKARGSEAEGMANARLLRAAPRLLKTLREISDRLTAWAEWHEARVDLVPQNERQAERNTAENYRELVGKAEIAFADVEGRK